MLAACGITTLLARSGTCWGGTPSARECTAACEQCPACLVLCAQSKFSSAAFMGCRVSVTGICGLSVGRLGHAHMQSRLARTPSAHECTAACEWAACGQAGTCAHFRHLGQGRTPQWVPCAPNMAVFRSDARTQRMLPGCTAAKQRLHPRQHASTVVLPIDCVLKAKSIRRCWSKDSPSGTSKEPSTTFF